MRGQADRDDWPPRFLFDVAYGCAAMKTASDFVKFATDHTKEYYYHDEDYKDDGHNDDHDAKVRRKGAVRPKKTNQHSRRLEVGRRTTVRAKKADQHSRTETRQAKAGDGQVVDVFDMVLGLWAYGSRKDLCRARKMEKERMRESVQKWRQPVTYFVENPPCIGCGLYPHTSLRLYS